MIIAALSIFMLSVAFFYSYAGCRYAERHIFIVLLSVVMLSVIVLSVVMLTVAFCIECRCARYHNFIVMLSVVMLNVSMVSWHQLLLLRMKTVNIVQLFNPLCVSCFCQR